MLDMGSIKVTSSKAIESGNLIVVLQITPQAIPDLTNVPLAIQHAKSQEGRRLIEAAIHDISDLMRPYALPPGTPQDRGQCCKRHFKILSKTQRSWMKPISPS